MKQREYYLIFLVFFLFTYDIQINIRFHPKLNIKKIEKEI